MVYIKCGLHEPITVQCIGEAGHGKGLTSRKRRQLRETSVIYNELFIYGGKHLLLGIGLSIN